jgi:hypothetical protein
MAPLKLAALALLAFNSLFAFANQGEVRHTYTSIFLSQLLTVLQAVIENIEELPDDEGTTPASGPMMGMLKVMAQASFPDSDVFGVKLVNGRPTTASFHVFNGEEDTVTVRVAGGTLWPLSESIDIINMGAAVRNLTSSVLNVQVPPDSNVTFEYQFQTEMHPQDLRLILAAIVDNSEGTTFQVQAFNGTVSIVEAPISILDPQMYFITSFPLSP